MMSKHMKMPGCMMPDGAAPCDEYQELWERVQRLEQALLHIQNVYTPNGDLNRDIERALYGN